MKCPVCVDVNLLMTERHGVEIDYCPQCRGVWLDRGELDKIIERAGTSNSTEAASKRDSGHQGIFSSQPIATPPVQHPAPHYQTPQHHPQQHQQQHYSNSHKHYPQHSGHYKKKKEGFLSELFDFD